MADSGFWAGEELLIMKNGEWMACRNIRTKQDNRIHDKFIGRGSAGVWYYSTFHFCGGNTSLRMYRNPPDNLKHFVDAFSLKPFDGKSDECLKVTLTTADNYGL